MIAELAQSWGGLPFAGGLLEQPYGIVVLGAQLRAYAKAFREYQADPSHASGPVRDLVLLTAKASAELRLERR